uniref:Uncharacterized protein n=1 Tax=Rhizophora mucronata TaxID=61149 RepID=A0A2P2Q891_RHIMU
MASLGKKSLRIVSKTRMLMTKHQNNQFRIILGKEKLYEVETENHLHHSNNLDVLKIARACSKTLYPCHRKAVQTCT